MSGFHVEEIVLVHYGELALKRGNRHFFEHRLADNIRRAFSGLRAVRVKRLYGRMVLRWPPEGPLPDSVVRETLGGVFGVAWYAPALATAMEWEAVLAATERLLPAKSGMTFGVRAKKADARWPLGRSETERTLGAAILERRDWKVDLTDPDLWVRVEFANGQALLSCRREPGLRGLPVGVSGRVVALLSGGIDSPAACFSMMSRGCRVTAVHFHSAPYTSRASQDKVVELTERLLRHQPEIDLHMVPFAELQREIVQKAPAPLRVILYRRFMLRIAEAVARREKAEALVTGESVGQVASQTLSNMRSVECAADLSVLRPLVGMDKESIVALAERAGTFDISIQPHDDCCSYLMPPKPATRSRPRELDAAEEELDVPALVENALAKTERLRLVRG